MKNLVLGLLILVSQSACGQKFMYNDGQADAKSYYEELPYEDVNGKLFVMVDVNGKPRRFLFDTGAVCMISTQLSDELQLKEVFHDNITDVNGSHFPMSAVRLDIKIGNTTFAGTPALKGLQGEIFKCWVIDGLIGSNMLRGSIVSFNSAKHVIIITNQKDKLTLNSQNSGKMNTHTDAQSTPVIEIPVGKKASMNFEFDSGDNKFLRLTTDLTNQLARANVYTVLGTGYGASAMGAMGLQKAAEKQRLLFKSVTVGGQQFTNALTETNAAGIPGIGTELLNYGVLTLDYPHQKYYFDPIKPVVNLEPTGWPVYPTVQNNQLVIGVVWDSAKDLAKPGEQILAIDGVDYSKMDICAIANQKPVFDGKETAVLTLKNADGTSRQLTIKKQVYSPSTVDSH